MGRQEGNTDEVAVKQVGRASVYVCVVGGRGCVKKGWLSGRECARAAPTTFPPCIDSLGTGCRWPLVYTSSTSRTCRSTAQQRTRMLHDGSAGGHGCRATWVEGLDDPGPPRWAPLPHGPAPYLGALDAVLHPLVAGSQGGERQAGGAGRGRIAGAAARAVRGAGTRVDPNHAAIGQDCVAVLR